MVFLVVRVSVFGELLSWFRFCCVVHDWEEMNADTERRLAAMIMEDANLMRQRAEKDGVGAYLAKPVVKARPNRQFLTAMVRGVQHGMCASLALFSPNLDAIVEPDFLLLC